MPVTRHDILALLDAAPPIIDFKQVCKILGVGTRHGRHLLNAGMFPAPMEHCGRWRRLWRREDVRHYVLVGIARRSGEAA
jgi:hypothetical protein